MVIMNMWVNSRILLDGMKLMLLVVRRYIFQSMWLPWTVEKKKSYFCVFQWLAQFFVPSNGSKVMATDPQSHLGSKNYIM